MTPNKNFRFTKRNKTLTALLPFKDAGQRAAFKDSMIVAQLASEVVVKREPRDKK